jgi:hypothetical protein
MKNSVIDVLNKKIVTVGSYLAILLTESKNEWRSYFSLSKAKCSAIWHEICSTLILF